MNDHFNSYFVVFRDLLHLLWFVSPLALMAVSVALNGDDEFGSWFCRTLAVLIQFSILIGYLEGWNVK